MIYKITLILNVLWFGSAFWYFSFKHEAAAKLLIPKSQRNSPIFKTMSAALPFLGGFNLALCVLALLLFLNPILFLQDIEKIILCIVFGVAHASQFLINVPVAKAGGRIDDAYWNVLTGPMLFIFVVDAIMMVVNLTCAVVIYF
jgi:hypothetical protein